MTKRDFIYITLIAVLMLRPAAAQMTNSNKAMALAACIVAAGLVENQSYGRSGEACATEAERCWDRLRKDGYLGW